VSSGRARLRVATLWLALSAGCSGLQPGNIGDDTGTSLEETLRDFRCDLGDAGLVSANLRYCAVAPFYEACPLRVCIEQFGRLVERACRAPDAGVAEADQELCDSLDGLAPPPAQPALAR
jgi:hypothetical protein